MKDVEVCNERLTWCDLSQSQGGKFYSARVTAPVPQVSRDNQVDDNFNVGSRPKLVISSISTPNRKYVQFTGKMKLGLGMSKEFYHKTED